MIAQQQDTLYALAEGRAALYMGRASGLYRSQDDGQTWQDSLTTLQHDQPLTITAVAAADKVVFAGSKGAVLRSEDDGQTWEIIGLASPPPLVTALALSPQFEQDGVVIATTAEDGVFLSEDGGHRWTAWNFGLLDMNVYAVVLSPDFPRDHIVFIGTESGLFRSHNGGKSWHEVDFPMSAAPVLSLAMPAAQRLYVGTEHSGLFISEDQGRTWRTAASETSLTAIHSLHAGNDGLWLLTEAAFMRMSLSGQVDRPFAQPFPSSGTPMTALISAHTSRVRVGFDNGLLLTLR